MGESGEPQAEALMKTLELFNYGTIEDYRLEEHKYTPLRKVSKILEIAWVAIRPKVWLPLRIRAKVQGPAITPHN